MQEHKTLNTFVKTLDCDISTIKLIETTIGDKMIYTVEIKQALFITEIQCGLEKLKALVLYNTLIDNKVDLCLDKFSVKDRECDICKAKNTMLYDFDNNMILCEFCACKYGVDNLVS